MSIERLAGTLRSACSRFPITSAATSIRRYLAPPASSVKEVRVALIGIGYRVVCTRDLVRGFGHVPHRATLQLRFYRAPACPLKVRILARFMLRAASAVSARARDTPFVARVKDP